MIDADCLAGRQDEIAWRARKSVVVEQMLIGAPLLTVLSTLCDQAAMQAPGFGCCALVYDPASACFFDVVGAEPADIALLRSALAAHDCVAQWRMCADLTPCAELAFDRRDIVELAASAPGGAAPRWAVAPVFSEHNVFYGVLVLLAEPGASGFGEPVRAVLRDASALASMAVKHRQTLDKLRITEIVFDASQSAIIVTNEDNRIISVNPSFTRITGYSLEDVWLKSPAILSSGRHTRAFYKDMWQSLYEHGTWHGETCNRKKNGELYYEWLTITARKDGQGRVEGYVGMFTDISDLKDAQRIISYQASHDSLTGLLNRRSCEEYINKAVQQAYKDGPRFAILFIDLDDFKYVNDTLGHSGGDLLLREAARRMQLCTRKLAADRCGDVLGRFGGDEFVLVAGGMESEADAVNIAEKIIADLSRDYDVAGTVVHVSASIGIAIYPDDADDTKTLLNRADQAMYEAKRLGRSRYVRYSPSIHYAAHTRAQIKAGLKQALRRNQLSVYYQPMVDLASGRPIKAEALIRWRHPKLGFVSPAVFIPLAEEAGMIEEIGLWVLKKALQNLKEWQAAGRRDIGISINLSPHQLAGPRFADSMLKLIADAEVPAEFVTFEITEGVIISDHTDCHSKLKRLKQRGATIALDDFGTGYSSLSYIKKYDIDYIKIDKVFVDGIDTNEEDRVLVETMIVMASKLRIKVVVEGVETESQLNTLREVGAQVIQGYYFSKALPHEEFSAWLLDGARSSGDAAASAKTQPVGTKPQ
ncbi:putative bifunctional diguanylate cyclase/phosphodiesterase [Methylogaea oryzae]|uniref:EAL domain-containing protein n=1 Tax=Methylogaea oryzae TaxID=1295382 RepID=A0A8D5AGU2_9GAMM|nr:GGDEF domain-containing phosphodiesterase [Methylogaea oryzae]BBL69566.1 hypothetical protein MoryE10_01720 [Methylogaea oryzae]